MYMHSFRVLSSRSFFVAQCMDWKAPLCCSHVPLEWSCTSLVCPMVMFGVTRAKVDALEGHVYPSWIPYACGYCGSFAIGTASFAIYGPSILSSIGYQLSPDVAGGIGSLCGHICTGLYAGSHRTSLREKYGIRGSQYGDFLTHCAVSPLALCQEAAEVHHHSEQRACDTHEDSYIAVKPHAPFEK